MCALDSVKRDVVYRKCEMLKAEKPENQNPTKGERLAKGDYDWQFSLAFTSKRHYEAIEGGNTITQTWRMKERVNFNVFCP